MKKLLVLLALAVGVLSTEANAAKIFYQCDTCVTDRDFEETAEVIGINEGGMHDTIYVANPNDRVMRKFSVEYWVPFEPGMPTRFVQRELSLNIDDIEAKEKFFDGHELLTKTIHEIPEEIANSAYDVVGNTQVFNNVKDWQQTSSPTFVPGYELLGALANIVTQWINVSSATYVVFADGSTATLVYTDIISYVPLKVDWKLVYAKDSDNNDIPLSKDAMESQGKVTLTATSNANNIQNFLALAQRWGVSISGGGTGLDTGHMECVGNESGGLDCVYYPD